MLAANWMEQQALAARILQAEEQSWHELLLANLVL